MNTLEYSLRRKKIDCIVETRTHWYAGSAKLLLKEIPQEDLAILVRYEHCTRIGNQRQWNIFADRIFVKNDNF